MKLSKKAQFEQAMTERIQEIGQENRRKELLKDLQEVFLDIAMDSITNKGAKSAELHEKKTLIMNKIVYTHALIGPDSAMSFIC